MFRLALLVSVGAVIIGCAPGQDSNRVRVANWGGATEENDFERTIQGLYRKFEAERGAEIKIEKIPGSQEYVSKMLLSFVAGTEPDVMALDASSAAVFIENGVLMDLMPFANSDPEFQLSDYYPNVVDIARRGDKLYAIPGDFTPMVIYYNKKLFDAAGVAYPKPGWTFAEFLSTAKKLTIPGANPRDPPRQWGFKLPNWMPGWIMWLWNNGGDVLSPDGTRASGFLDSRASVQALTFLRDLILVHKVAPSLSSTAATGVDVFQSGEAAMEVSGHWAIVGYQGAKNLDLDQIGVVELPTNLPPEGGRRRSVTVMYEMGFAIGKNCKNSKLAWEFVKFATSRRFQEVYNSTGIAVCARKDVSQERAKDAREQAFLDIVPTARPPWGAKVEGYAFVEMTGVQMMDRILAGADPQTAATEAASRIDRYFSIR